MGQPGSAAELTSLAELSALGCILLDSPLCEASFDILLPEMFADPNLAEVYRTCLALREQGKTVDVVTAAECLGGAYTSLVMDCCEVAPRIERAEEYAEIVRENWRKRTTAGRLFEIAQDLSGPGTMMQQGLAEIERVAQAQRDIESKIQNATARVMRDCIGEWRALMDSPPSALNTGYADLDRLTGGLERGGLYVLAARPGEGKSDLALNLAMRMCRQHRVTYHTLELSRVQCTQRMASNVARVNEYLMRSRNLSEEDHRNTDLAAGLIENMDIVLDERPFTSQADIKSSILKTRPDLLIVDHLLLMDKQLQPGQKDFEGISRITKFLKTIAKTHGIVVLAIGQSLRETDKNKKEPVLADVQGGGAIDQDADGVCIIRADRGEGWVSGERFWPAKLHWVKNRHGGLGVLRFQYYPQYHKFVSESTNHFAPNEGVVEIEDNGDMPF